MEAFKLKTITLIKVISIIMSKIIIAHKIGSVCSVFFLCGCVCAHLSLDRGLGSGRRTIRALPARVAGGDMGKLVSREPDFLCRGSSPMAPAMSLSIGQEPARPCDAIGQEPERAWW